MENREKPIWPRFDDDDLQAAHRVLSSGKVNYWTGEEGRRFEEGFAQYIGVRHAIALANGTLALELALIALDLSEGEVVVPARTFVATASAVRRVGLTPVFADVDADSGCVTARTLEAACSQRTRAVIVVHLGGWPCDMGSIVDLCRGRDLHLIEDCAQAHGAVYRGQKVGSFGVASAFSFCQDKIMTTAGEGGMMLTNDRTLWERAWSFKDHGKDWKLVYETEHPVGFRWLHAHLGTNWRLSEVQSAIGRNHLRKLDTWLEHRRALATRYQRALKTIPGVRVPVPPADLVSAAYRQYAYVEQDALAAGWSRNRLVEELLSRGVRVGSGSCGEIYREAAFPSHMQPPTRLPVAKQLGETSLAFLVDPTIQESDVDETCGHLADIMRKAVR